MRCECECHKTIFSATSCSYCCAETEERRLEDIEQRREPVRERVEVSEGSKRLIKLMGAAPALLAALEAVQEAFAYTGPSALPRDAGVDWEAVAEQVDLAIYESTNVGPEEVN